MGWYDNPNCQAYTDVLKTWQYQKGNTRFACSSIGGEHLLSWTKQGRSNTYLEVLYFTFLVADVFFRRHHSPRSCTIHITLFSCKKCAWEVQVCCHHREQVFLFVCFFFFFFFFFILIFFFFKYYFCFFIFWIIFSMLNLVIRGKILN